MPAATTTTTTTYTVARINKPVPDALFRFVPPDGATEVARFNSLFDWLRWRFEAVGKPAPDFTLKDVDGREVALKDLRGKAVLLNFWATWCEPCRDEMPHLEALHEAFKDKGLVVIGINATESAEIARKYFAEQGYTFQSLLDPAGDAYNKYGAGGYPGTVLIDKDGIVRYAQRGFNSKVDLRAEVLKLGL